MRVRNIFICSTVVFCASSRMMKESFSERPRMNASGATSMTLRSMSAPDAIEAHHLVQRVVHRPQVRIDLLRQVAGQEAQPLARLDRRPHQHDAAHAIRLQRLDRASRPRDRSCRCPPGRCRRSGRCRGCASRYSRWFGPRPRMPPRCVWTMIVMPSVAALQPTPSCVVHGLGLLQTHRCTRSGVSASLADEREQFRRSTAAAPTTAAARRR